MISSHVAAEAADTFMTIDELIAFVAAAKGAEVPGDHQLTIRTKGLTARLSRIETIAPKARASRG